MASKHYTARHKKRATIWGRNSHVSCWICTLLVSMVRGSNALQKSYKIYNFTLAVSLHYLMKLNMHKMAHFEVSCHSVLLLNSSEVSELFFYKLLENSFSSFPAENLIINWFLMKIIINFIFKTQQYLIDTKVNIHDLHCDINCMLMLC